MSGGPDPGGPLAAGGAAPLRVLVADDQELVRAGFRLIAVRSSVLPRL